MCIICREPFKVASKDIVCWKQLWKSSLFGFVYTPVMKRLVFPWVLSGKVPYRARGSEEYEVLDDYKYFVGGGFVYSYAKIESVFSDDGVNVAYKCVIPKGTWYWVSEDGSMYASECLRFVEKVR